MATGWMSRARESSPLFRWNRICMVFPPRSTKTIRLTTTPSFNYIIKSISCQHKTLARALLIRRSSSSCPAPHARSRSKLNQRNHTSFSVAAHERFAQATILLTADQSHRDHLYTTTSDRHGYEPSAYHDAIADRMRRWRWRQRTVSGTGWSHRVPRMESGSRLLNPFLFRILWPAITRSTG